MKGVRGIKNAEIIIQEWIEIAQELDLSVHNLWYDEEKEKQLTEIPSEVFELTQLQVLNLVGNKLSTLPESFGNISNLTSLDLSRNQLFN